MRLELPVQSAQLLSELYLQAVIQAPMTLSRRVQTLQQLQLQQTLRLRQAQ